ncbi:penicillin-binding protein 2 [Streptomyces piniterrae]|uniref:Penicillin-binding protein 2 n=1 Tax=Streptomyces piniterrae TaxID=2571125 RepID=A0A4U0MYN8_9ACTN|nr:penicillin-binding transpeptidase domain-containing protein [Streptomyces piniterrae]TJZ45996.1 penicillin-binding protein 2 [Streptomyces piniterrae]
MIRCIRHTAAFTLLLLVALLVNAARVQLFAADEYTGNAANRRTVMARYAQPRGAVLVAGRPVTGSRDSGGRLRYERTYTEGPLYAPVTGYSSQEFGTSQIERAEDGILSGTDERLTTFAWWDELARAHRPGGNVVTTIRPDTQRAAFDGLGPRKGAVVAIEPRTGRILALASTPSYDPGELSGNGPSAGAAWLRLNNDADRPLLNRAIRQTYPPGSAFEVVTAAAALDSGLVTDIDAPADAPDPYPPGGAGGRFGNPSTGCAHATLRAAFLASCDTVFARLGAGIGARGMADAARGFGFDGRGLRIPSPVVPSTFGTRMAPAQVAQSAIGRYRTTATPLQMAMVAAAVANDGTLTPPRLVDRVTDADGTTVFSSSHRRARQAMGPATAQRLQEMMVDVVAHGSGRQAAIEGVTVGGKGGTAPYDPHNEGTPYAWFLSWARAKDRMQPAVAVAVVVEDPENVVANPENPENPENTEGPENPEEPENPEGTATVRADSDGAAPIARAVMRAALD